MGLGRAVVTPTGGAESALAGSKTMGRTDWEDESVASEVWEKKTQLSIF